MFPKGFQRHVLTVELDVLATINWLGPESPPIGFLVGVYFKHCEVTIVEHWRWICKLSLFLKAVHFHLLSMTSVPTYLGGPVMVVDHGSCSASGYSPLTTL